ncbi:MAG: hypothetical protein IJS63_04120 [Bacteroidaceae bacterium]|nr:hypothetical protein [Bacteroidaceae bacterium]
MNKTVLTIILLLAGLGVNGQCRYCRTYEDFLEDKWEPLDTVFCKEQSKGHAFMWGYSNIMLKTGDKDFDKKINYSVFAVMQGKTLYVNNYNLRFEKSRFGKGFSKAARIGENDLLFVNKLAGKEARENVSKVMDGPGVMFGLVGAGIAAGVTANKQMKNKVCYVLSPDADDKGSYDIQLLDDRMMDKLLLSRDLTDLHTAYYAEQDKAKRRLASRILPILMEAGIIETEE